MSAWNVIATTAWLALCAWLWRAGTRAKNAAKAARRPEPPPVGTP